MATLIYMYILIYTGADALRLLLAPAICVKHRSSEQYLCENSKRPPNSFPLMVIHNVGSPLKLLQQPSFALDESRYFLDYFGSVELRSVIGVVKGASMNSNGINAESKNCDRGRPCGGHSLPL
jgi:hypothetical protein